MFTNRLSAIELFRSVWRDISSNFHLMIPFLVAGLINLIVTPIPFKVIYPHKFRWVINANVFTASYQALITILSGISLIISIIGLLIIYYLELIGFKAYLNYLESGATLYYEASNYVFMRFIKFLVAGVIALILISLVITSPIGYLLIAGIIVDDLGVIEALNRSFRIASTHVVTFVIILIISLIIYFISMIIPFISPILVELATGYIGMVYMLAYIRER